MQHGQEMTPTEFANYACDNGCKEKNRFLIGKQAVIMLEGKNGLVTGLPPLTVDKNTYRPTMIRSLCVKLGIEPP